ncbi:MAG: B12-binding domain-containing radical SAM protein [Deltaproteobacteria bacterium]|nr:B12-binding domain-containing radical SAM protein [Deltaproteobacteria bacterium]
MIESPNFNECPNVLCIYPWKQGIGVANWLPPLGLEYISASIEKNGIHTDIIDMRFESDPAPLAEYSAKVICISVNWEDQLTILPWLIKQFKSDKIIIIGGRVASFNVKEILQNCPQVKIVVRGDGEQTIREIFSEKPLEEITGLSYRKNDRIFHNPPRRSNVISEDISPDRSKRKNPYHIRIGDFDTGIPFDLLSSSKGCPFNCKFCTFNRNPLGEKRQWTGRSPQSVVKELEEIEAQYVLFTDDYFAADIKRVEAICDLILLKKVKKTLGMALRIEVAFHEEVLKKLFKAGFRFLSLGIESTKDKTLLEMEKGFDTAKVREACRLLRKHPFILLGYFLIGNIGENEGDMLKIADFAQELGLDIIYPIYLKLEKYSQLEELVKKSPEYYIDNKGFICSKRYSRDHLKSIRHRIHRRFYKISKMLAIAHKVLQNNLFSWRDALKILFFGMRHRRKRTKRIKQQL